MSEASRVTKSEDAPLPLSNNNELSKIAWQKWINKNKERDAAYRQKLIRILWLVLSVPLFWLLTVKK